MTEWIENQKIAVISAAISAHSGIDPSRLIIRKISAETPKIISKGDESLSFSKEQESIQEAGELTTSPWTLTGREDLMQTRKSRPR